MRSFTDKRPRRPFHETEAAASAEVAWLRACSEANVSGEATGQNSSVLAAQIAALARNSGIDLARGVRALGYRSLSDFVLDQLEVLDQ